MKTKHPLFLYLCLILLLTASACDAEYDGLSVSILSEPPVSTQINDRRIRMTSGTAVAVELSAKSRRREDFPDDARIELQSDDTAILRILPMRDDNQMILTAIQPGTTTVRVLIDGSRVDWIDVTVVEHTPLQ